MTIDTFVEWVRARVGGCSCSFRFFGVAFDIDCPHHGIESPRSPKVGGGRVPVLTGTNHRGRRRHPVGASA